MYKQIPKALLRNKWELSFYVSYKLYEKQKHLIHNDRFLGVTIKVLHTEALNEESYLIGFNE